MVKIYSEWLYTATAFFALSSATLDRRAAVDDCLKSHQVPVYAAGTANYTQAIKPFNLRLSFTPASYAVPQTIKHIQDAVACGVANKIPVTAKCGGHSYAAHGLGGENAHLIVDMQRFNSVTVDQQAQRAVVQAGGRLGNIALALYDQGKQAISHGTCPGVGVSGLTLHGGYGLSSRKHGLALDNVVSATVVLANSTVVTASADSNQDLFWALRGAGAAFGIVVDFTFKTFTPLESNVIFDYSLSPKNTSQLAKYVTALQDFSINDQPAELDMRMFLPKQLTGVYHGNRSEFDKVMAPLLAKLDIPAGSGKVSVKGWIDTLTHFAFGPLKQAEVYDTHENFYAKSLMPEALSPAAIKAMSDYYFTTASKITRGWYLLIDLHGGKSASISQVGPDETSYSHRKSIFKMQFYDRIFPDNATYKPEYMSFLNGWVNAIEDASNGSKYGMYVNYADTGLSRTEAHSRYWGEHYDRLVKIKKSLDPNNVFEGPQLVGS
ncbi:Glucooligosaccharide oxidase [Pyrenophora tritici-repentis]|nr:Glucooligosaccharide oxidase [Pyrenophora tritici-repentis]KAI2477353.1 Glucooligosaccharide oxidase [Pyrenophora tritici-repentis]